MVKPYQIAGEATPSPVETKLIDVVADFLNSQHQIAGLLIVTFPSGEPDGPRPAMIPMACTVEDAAIIMEIAARIDGRMSNDIKEILTARKRPT